MTEITPHDAIQIVSKHLECIPSRLTVLAEMPENSHIYKVSNEPSWIVSVFTTELQLSGTHIVLVGKQSGAIHYNGSAQDEG